MNKQRITLYLLIPLILISLSCSFLGQVQTPSTNNSSGSPTEASNNSASSPSTQPTTENSNQVTPTQTGNNASAPTQESSTVSPETDPIKFYIQNVSVGDETKDKIYKYVIGDPIKEGWQYVFFDLVIENAGNNSFQNYELQNYPLGLIKASLTDTGGYSRDLILDFSIPESGFATFTYPQYIFPGMRYRIFAFSEIPQAYQPDKVSIQLWNSASPVILDVKQAQNNISLPFDVPPSYIPLADNGTFEYTEPNKYHLRYSDFKFCYDEIPYRSTDTHYARVATTYTFEIENLDGQTDLKFYGMKGNAPIPALYTMSDEGYTSMVPDFGEGYLIPPVSSKIFSRKAYFASPLISMQDPEQSIPGFKVMWVVLVDPNGQTVGMIKLEPGQIGKCE